MDEYLPKPVRMEKLAAALAGLNGNGDSAPHRGETVSLTQEKEAGDAPDWPHALDLFEGDREALGSFAELVATALPVELETLERAVLEGRRDDAGRLAHNLKSTAATFGAGGLAGAAEELERRMKNGRDSGDALERVRRLGRELMHGLARRPEEITT
ncbi:Hpt domain-containing protein [Desulfohalovibrio reitneri]|uniref:Hpt domain-containing protein n=1 Tax=Desulfohalovibrio reitneri TaxID=1307759 RepID=UPI0004A6EB97|nr:Hpt domain-containing protein [Desulfohalovibrio reitneri]